MVIDNDEPFAAKEGFIDFVPVKVGKLGGFVAPDISLGAGVGLEKMVVEELIDDHGVVVCAEVIVAAPCQRAGASASETVPKLIEPSLMHFQKSRRKIPVGQIGKLQLECVLIGLSQKLFA
jgi:hypothetical protein